MKSLRQGFVGRQNGPEPSSPDPPDLLGSSGPELWHPEPILRKDLTCSVTNSTKNTSKKKLNQKNIGRSSVKTLFKIQQNSSFPEIFLKKGPLKNFGLNSRRDSSGQSWLEPKLPSSSSGVATGCDSCKCFYWRWGIYHGRPGRNDKTT